MSQCPPGLDNNIGRGGGQKGLGSRKQLGSTLPKSQKITYLPRTCRETLYPQTLNRVPGDHLSIILHQKQKRANSAHHPHTWTYTNTHYLGNIPLPQEEICASSDKKKNDMACQSTDVHFNTFVEQEHKILNLVAEMK